MSKPEKVLTDDLWDMIETSRLWGVIGLLTATHDLKMIDVSDRIFWIRDGKVDRIETRVEVAVGAVE